MGDVDAMDEGTPPLAEEEDLNSLFVDEDDSISDDASRVHGWVSETAGGFFAGGAAARRDADEARRTECARACLAPRITPLTPRLDAQEHGRFDDTSRDTVRFHERCGKRVNPAARGFASNEAESRKHPRTSRGRLIAPPAFTDAHFVPKERRALWCGPAGTLPSAREVIRLVEAMASTQKRLGVPVIS
jgi:hypothetical protein